MPDLEPVSHDPFATQLMPVGGDPFASMTHLPDQPAQPYMHPNVPAAANAIVGFAGGGLQGAGVQGPDWWQSNPIQRALQNPDNEIAMGALAKVPVREGLLGKFKLEDLHQDFQAGLNNQQIANKYNVTKEAIQQRRTQMGYPQKPRGRPWPSRLEPVSHDPFAEE